MYDGRSVIGALVPLLSHSLVVSLGYLGGKSQQTQIILCSTVSCYVKYACLTELKSHDRYVLLLILKIISRLSRNLAMQSQDFLEIVSRLGISRRS
jgi:hypothetical protein